MTVKNAPDNGTIPWSSWTSRDEQILETVALKCRVLEHGQLAAHWWRPRSRRARRRLAQLCRAGLLHKYRVMSHPMLQLTAPVFRWTPGDAGNVDCEQISHRLRARWTEPSRSHLVYTASQKTALLFGRPGRYQELPKVLELTHDLHVGQLYLYYRRQAPELATDWVGEDMLGKAGENEKDPDAFLIDDQGVRYRVCEFGGKYDAMRVADFHGYCVRHQIGYELW